MGINPTDQSPHDVEWHPGETGDFSSQDYCRDGWLDWKATVLAWLPVVVAAGLVAVLALW